MSKKRRKPNKNDLLLFDYHEGFTTRLINVELRINETTLHTIVNAPYQPDCHKSFTPILDIINELIKECHHLTK